MGVMETKVVQVRNDPAVLNRVNEVWGSFGWSVLSVQVTHTQNTKTYSKNIMDYYSGDQTVETTTINYATVTYQRDKGMDNYQEITELEGRFNAEMSKLDALPQYKRASLMKFLGLELLVALACGIIDQNLAIVGSWVFCIAYAVYLIFKHKARQKTKKTEEQIEATLDQIRVQAAQLV